ncbi:asparaginase [Colwellia sp. Arc7-D]|jgi:L-asparaginase|uniref:asparaginase n=1 Tax=Colwellia sp. Arc7-D TaxID=2161872 RepID=UPI000D39547A|nr:asparaginase [Colwellia sp. Arc7-D]AWB57770.1 L-asparaginase 1 [Colwellia sp. Arc7-D]|tara:strand:+ start:2965 stop:3969 length:1005 start_codon:yes stop_codon:yes gene_type:complete
MRKRIYIAYTGGTIGMKPSENGYIPQKQHLTDAIMKMPDFHREEMPEFTINEYQPLIDSSNMSPADWQHIANDIQQHYDDYDGFVVLHGTDTMAYTSSALSFMLENLSKPVIVTGSQIPLSQLRSDGQENLLNSLYIAANYPINEVGLYFNNKLFRGNRSIKAYADGFNAFDSPNLPPLLEAGINIKLIEGKISEPVSLPLKLAQITPQPIGVVHLYPGISVELIKNIIKQPVKALIIRSYGVGNAPQNQAMLDCLKQANDDGIVIVNCSQCIKGTVNMKGYATGNALSKIGVISGNDMTLEATLTKLHYLLSKEYSHDKICQLLEVSLRGELS